ncbi:MAG: GNAT family N-acetyltransferase [Acidobacteria bacterium]|nr:GNAT family N-acetyltransferase [Acidobacteriota bacterium]
MTTTFDLREASEVTELDQIRRLFGEYAASLGIDLGFQDFDTELASLPGAYAPPGGSLILANRHGIPVGCVAVRPLCREIAEMKRLYVRPAARGQQLGRLLAVRAIAFARAAGYASMRLDTLSTMNAALTLYRGLGFRDIPPYRYNPIEGAVFLELDLHRR